MKFDSKQNIEMLGVLAVILSLIFVAWELRQSNRIAIAATEADLRVANREFVSLVVENLEIAEIIIKANNDAENLTQAEALVMASYSQASFNVLTQANAAYENGMLTSYSLEVFKDSIIRNFRDSPFMIKYFADNVRDFELYLSDSELWAFLTAELEGHGYAF